MRSPPTQSQIKTGGTICRRLAPLFPEVVEPVGEDERGEVGGDHGYPKLAVRR